MIRIAWCQKVRGKRCPAGGSLRILAFPVLLLMLSCTGCGRDDAVPKPRQDATRRAAPAKAPAPSVTISGDDRAAGLLSWSAPVVVLQPDQLTAAKRDAANAVKEQRWYADAQ